MNLIEHLEALGEGKEVLFKYLGLCSEIHDLTGMNALKLLKEYFKTWEHYSGDEIYPVPSTNKNCSAEEYYDSSFNLWSGKQGKLRRSLCRHIAKEMRKENE